MMDEQQFITVHNCSPTKHVLFCLQFKKNPRFSLVSIRAVGSCTTTFWIFGQTASMALFMLSSTNHILTPYLTH